MFKTLLILVAVLISTTACTKNYYMQTGRSICNVALDDYQMKQQCRLTTDEVIKNMPELEKNQNLKEYVYVSK